MKELAVKILELVGGKENIRNCAHCATRLRLLLVDEKKADTEAIKKLPGVLTVVFSGGQYQIVIGDTVPELFDEMQALLGNRSGNNVPKAKSKNILGSLLDLTTSIFSPTIGALAAGGMLKGILALLVALHVMDSGSGTYMILYSAANAVFYYYPILLGYTSGQRFGLNPFVGLAIGAAFVYPDMVARSAAEPLYMLFSGTLLESKVQAEFLGIPVILMNYSTSVIPVIVTNFFAGIISEKVGKVIPKMVRKIFLPVITIAVAVPLGILLIGPVVTWGCNGVGFVITSLFEMNNTLTSAILGFLWQPLVMFGLHKGLIPVVINNLAVYGYDYIYPVSSIAAYATAGAVLGVFYLSKNKERKEISMSSFIQAMIASITEPALYGITLPLKKPFLAANIAAAIGGLIIGFFNTQCHFMASGSFFGAPAYMEPDGTFGRGFWGIVIAWGVVIVAGFLLTVLFGIDEAAIDGVPEETDKNAADKPADGKAAEKQAEAGTQGTVVKVAAPVAGEVVALEALDDPVFASKAMGDGVAVRPTNDMLYAPVDGTIKFVYPSGHAIGMTTDDGLELIIHMGIDTAELKGVFAPKVEAEQKVKKGDSLIGFDLKKLRSQGKDSAVIVVATNSAAYAKIETVSKGTVKEKEELLVLTAR